MAGFVHIRVEGEPELTRMLTGIEQAVSDRAIRTGLRAGSLIVKNDAKRRVPKVSGTLSRSITDAPVPGKLAHRTGTDLIYGPRVEYGFTERDKLGRRYNQPAQPYLRPAASENTREVRGAVFQVIHTGLLAATA